MKLALGLALMLGSAAAAQEAPPVPETRSCLALNMIRDTNVVDSKTIDFTLRNGTVWRNRLAFECPQLGFERAFSYETSISQLCKQDVITVIQLTGSRQMGARCGLGEFVRQPPKPKRGAKP